jgi:hypothetical protein
MDAIVFMFIDAASESVIPRKAVHELESFNPLSGNGGGFLGHSCSKFFMHTGPIYIEWISHEDKNFADGTSAFLGIITGNGSG